MGPLPTNAKLALLADWTDDWGEATVAGVIRRGERLLESPLAKVVWNGAQFDVPRLRQEGFAVGGPVLDFQDGWHLLDAFPEVSVFVAKDALAPAAFAQATGAESARGRQPCQIGEPYSDGMSAVSSTSLMPMGMPCSGPGPAARAPPAGPGSRNCACPPG